jgi:sugar lactone lactonase YvrE
MVRVMILPVLVLGAATVLAEPMALYDQALQARQQHDVPRFLELTRQLTDWAPANPPLRFLHAEALAMSGRTGPAIVELRWLATHGYHYAFWERDSFASLPADPATTALREATTRNGQPSGLLAQVIRIDPADLDAEGIDAVGSEWILGSMANGSLYRVDRAGTATQVWRETEPSRRMLGVRNDAARKVVWACSTGPNDAEPQSELLRISLQPGRVERFRLPDPRTLCNDVALLPDGTVAISDSQRGAIWQLAATGTWRTLAGPGTFGYPNGLTWLDAAQRLVVADLRGLWTIDLANARIAAVDAPEGTFVGGIDGLYASDGKLWAMQNGLRPHRVVRIALTKDAARVERMETIASNLPDLAGMTTAAVSRREVTVLAGRRLVQLVSLGSADD